MKRYWMREEELENLWNIWNRLASGRTLRDFELSELTDKLGMVLTGIKFRNHKKLHAIVVPILLNLGAGGGI